MIRKLTIGQNNRFRWVPPRDEGLAIQATLTISFPGGAQSYALEGRVSDEVTAISADRQRITLTYGESGNLQNLLYGDPAPCWLQYGARNQAPCRVVRLVSDVLDGDDVIIGGVVELAEQLPVGVTAGGQLEWLTLVATIESEDLPAAPIRAVKWVVQYTPTEWGQAGLGSSDKGSCAVVWAPFATGLTDSSLAKFAPWTETVRPKGSSSWSDQIEAGLDHLVSVVQPNLPEGVWEDDMVGDPWLRAHALATQILILQDLISKGVDRTAALEVIEKDFLNEIKNRLARPEWIDVDHDNVVDDAEVIPPATNIILSHVNPDTMNTILSDARPKLSFVRMRVSEDR